MVDEAAQKAKEEYLKKYLSKDDKSVTKKKHKKKKNIGTGLKIHEDDAFVAVAPCGEQSSSDDESRKKIVRVLEKAKLQDAPKFKPAAFQSVDIQEEVNSVRKRHDSSSDEFDVPDKAPLPSTSEQAKKNSQVSSFSSTVQARRKSNDNSDTSPPRRKVKDEPPDSDASPPRRTATSLKKSAEREVSNGDSDASPPRRSNLVRDDDSDASPPRRRARGGSFDRDPNQRGESGPERYRHRKRRRSESAEFVRRKRSRDEDSDASPPRREDRDRSRRKHREGSRDGSRSKRLFEGHRERRGFSGADMVTGQSKHKSSHLDVKPVTGKSAGLKSLEAHREEMKNFKEEEEKLLENWEEFSNGKNAAAIRRAKLTGKGRETKEDRERKEREARKQEELEEKYKKWNRGLRQIEERSEKLNEMARVAQEGFARHADDIMMNVHMKEQLYAKDPMFKYVKKKKEKAEAKSGTVYPKYNGSWPPNRFNIAPGYRWDGVNRSNGFEDKIAEVANRKAAQQTEFYENIAKYEV